MCRELKEVKPTVTLVQTIIAPFCRLHCKARVGKFVPESKRHGKESGETRQVFIHTREKSLAPDTLGTLGWQSADLQRISDPINGQGIVQRAQAETRFTAYGNYLRVAGLPRIDGTETFLAPRSPTAEALKMVQSETLVKRKRSNITNVQRFAVLHRRFTLTLILETWSAIGARGG